MATGVLWRRRDPVVETAAPAGGRRFNGSVAAVNYGVVTVMAVPPRLANAGTANGILAGHVVTG
ncbi:hypothetical protein BVIR_2162 [Blastochloris viridis]|uniref:Uncharacterized protein n=1 Tax=Blastochloris viridis TaxID=1079 RepID=A0A0P0JD15_BLAVI|nr:hypothetical protein BVIR_2162 [Blastochloris viridis]CUU42594.1 hypothetical protein BVIRIDIS_16070 [Blastochloris viridis]